VPEAGERFPVATGLRILKSETTAFSELRILAELAVDRPSVSGLQAGFLPVDKFAVDEFVYCANLVPMSKSEMRLVEQILEELLPEQIVPERGFERWFAPLKLRVRAQALKLHGEVGVRLETARQEILRREGLVRDVWFMTGGDGVSLMKSVPSVRSRLGRKLLEDGDRPDRRLSLEEAEEIVLSFRDLGRFRVVCDLPLDVEEARKILLPEPGAFLLGRYPADSKDYTYDLNLRKALKGHRAWHFKVEVEGADGQRTFVEIQLMTLLQHAWDRRNHPLYEWYREGGSLPARLQINDIALAETLHLVDEQASRNWEEFLACRKGESS